jgi:heme-degrading monooxygenase HmoA
MITEIADLRVAPGTQEPFVVALQLGLDTVLSKAHGYLSHEIQHCIESPERYVLLIKWQTLEDHTVGFRQSEAYAKWRAIVGPFFAQPPHVEHFETLVSR